VFAADSAGHIQAQVTRTLNVVPGNGPGTYASGGTMTISRS